MVAHAQAREAGSAELARFETEEDRQGRANFRGSFSGYERNRLFVGVGASSPSGSKGRRYLEAGHALGLDFEHDGRAVAPLDVDGDGDLELAILSLQGLSLAWNQAPSRSFVKLRLRATRTSPDALGALVRITAAGATQVDRVRLTAGFHTQVSPEVHFGLGAATEVEAVEVRWPSGQTQRWEGLPTRARLRLTEGAVEAERLQSPRWPQGAAPGADRAYDPKLAAAPLVGVGAPRPLVRPGRSTLVNFWAPWCEACARELPALAAFATRAGGQVDVVTVSVEVKDLAGARAFAGRLAGGLEVRLANDDVVRSFFGDTGRIPLPATFAFAGDGALVRGFHREIGAADLDAVGRHLLARPSLEDFRVLVERHLRTEAYAEARAAIEAGLRAVDTPLARRRLGTLMLALDPQRAVALLEAGLAEDPADADAWAALARGLLARDPARARRAAAKALELAPGHAAARHVRARLERR